MARKYESAIIITGDASGAISAVQATDDHLRQLNQRQRRNIQTTNDWGRAWTDVTRVAKQAAVAFGAYQLGQLAATQARSVVETDRLAKSLGVATGQLQAMQYAAGSVGIDASKMGDILKDVSDKIGDAYANNAGEALDIINNLGLSVDKLIQLSPDEQLLAIGDALEKFDSRAAKVNALESISDDGSRLLGLLKNNGAEMRRLMDQAYDLNVAMPAQDIETFREADHLIYELTGTVKGLFNTFAAGVADANLEPLKASMRKLREIVTDPEFQQAVVDLAASFGNMLAGAGRDFTQISKELGSLGDQWNVWKGQLGLGDELANAVSNAKLLRNNLSFLETTQQSGTFSRVMAGYYSQDALSEKLAETRQAIVEQDAAIFESFSNLASWAPKAAAAQQTVSDAAVQAALALNQEQKASENASTSAADRAAAQKAAAAAEKAHQQALKESASAYAKLFGELAPAGKAQADYQATLAKLRVELDEGTKSQLEYYAAVSQAAIAYNKAVEQADPLAIKVKSLTSEFDANFRRALELEQAVKDLNTAYRAGSLDGGYAQYQRMLGNIRDEMRQLALESDPAAQEMARAWEEAANRIDETFADAFTGAFSSFEDFGDQLLDGFKRLLGELAYQATLKPIVVSITGQLGGALGLASTGAGDQTMAGGMNQVGGNLTSLGTKAYDLVTNGVGNIAWTGASNTDYAGAGWVNSATSGIGQSGFMGGSTANFSGATGLASAGAGMLGGYAGTELGSSLFGKQANSSWGATGGALIGTYFGGPLGAAIGGAAGGMLDSAFGSGYTPLSLALATGDQPSGNGYWDRGTAYSSPFGNVGYRDRGTRELYDHWGQQPAEQFLQSIAQADTAFAQIADSSAQVQAMAEAVQNIVLEGGGPDEIRAQLGQRYKAAFSVIDNAFNDAFQQFGGGVDQVVSLAGALDTLDASLSGNAQAIADARSALGSSGDMLATAQSLAQASRALGVLSDNADRLNLQFTATAEGALTAAGNLAELAGGVQNLASIQQGYYQAVFSDNERLSNSVSDLVGQFEAAGVAMPATTDELRNLVEAQDLSTQAGRELQLQLMQLAPSFANTVDAVSRAIRQQYQDSLDRAPDASGLDYWIGQVTSGSITLEQALERIANSLEATSSAITLPQASVDTVSAAVASYNNALDAIEQQTQARQEQFKNESRALETLKQLSDSLLLSDQSPLDPRERLNEAQRQFAALQVRAENGDTSAVSQLQGASSTYLDAAASYYGQSSTQYARIFADVTGSVDDLRGEFQSSLDKLGSLEAIQHQGLLEQQRARDLLTSSLSEMVGQTDVLGSIADLISALPDSLANALASILPKEAGSAGSGTGSVGSGQGWDATTYLANKTNQVNSIAQGGRTDWTGQEVLAKIIHDYGSLQAHYDAIGRDEGVQPFATGGAFTNGIVDRPTQFDMAVMGEAGPEAIMPLSNVGGSLGVNVSGAVDMAPVVAELQALRREVEQLRRERGSDARQAAEQRRGQTDALKGVKRGLKAPVRMP